MYPSIHHIHMHGIWSIWNAVLPAPLSLPVLLYCRAFCGSSSAHIHILKTINSIWNYHNIYFTVVSYDIHIHTHWLLLIAYIPFLYFSLPFMLALLNSPCIICFRHWSGLILRFVKYYVHVCQFSLCVFVCAFCCCILYTYS